VIGAVCDDRAVLDGPAEGPSGSVVVQPGEDLSVLTGANPAGTVFWLAPGVHTLADGEFAQVVPKDGNTYVGAPGAVLDGRGVNRYAFTQQAANVTIEHLTVTGFVAPNNEGVVNHDAGDDWTIRHTTIENNAGAGLMIGDGNLVEGNCLRDNGQYGFNAYEPDGVVDVTLRGNEITGNNTDDWESQQPGCGCTGGGKFWNTTGAVVEDNYIHHNLSVGLWADGVNSDFLIDGNRIEANHGEGIFYEQSYNATITNNTLIGNALVKGPTNPGFPAGAIYISEAGADPRAPGGQSTLQISGNTFQDNWSGVILWENADRFAGSPADTSNAMTLVNPDITRDDCANPALIGTEPYYSDCRWNTQNVLVTNNSFAFDPTIIGPDCTPENGCGFNGLFSNFGTYPDWSPYQGTVIQDAITFTQNNTFTTNTYTGPWQFKAFDPATTLTWDEWRTDPYNQDTESTLQ
jgi:parallel beta-helix repeat protein